MNRLEDAERKIRREIAIMKKCRHGQIVQLFEVIDDQLKDSVFMSAFPFSSSYSLSCFFES